jgi:hypothetical protein
MRDDCPSRRQGKSSGGTRSVRRRAERRVEIAEGGSEPSKRRAAIRGRFQTFTVFPSSGWMTLILGWRERTAKKGENAMTEPLAPQLFSINLQVPKWNHARPITAGSPVQQIRNSLHLKPMKTNITAEL